MEAGTRRTRRRRRFRRRLRYLIPLVALAAIAAGIVLVIRGSSGRAELGVASSYVRAWAADDYGRMYSLLDPASRARTSEPRGWRP